MFRVPRKIRVGRETGNTHIFFFWPKLNVKHNRLNIKEYFFSHVIQSWNKLLESVVTAPAVNTFKNRTGDFVQANIWGAYGYQTAHP